MSGNLHYVQYTNNCFYTLSGNLHYYSAPTNNCLQINTLVVFHVLIGTVSVSTCFFFWQDWVDILHRHAMLNPFQSYMSGYQAG